MKTKLFYLLFFFLVLKSFSQAPNEFSYQAVIRGADGALKTNTNIGIKIQILQASVNGTVVYTETQNISTNSNGLVITEIGGDNSNVINGALSSIDWSSNIFFLKVETDIAGGTNYTIASTNQLLSVPYAIHAKTATSISGAGGGGFATITQLNQLQQEVDELKLTLGQGSLTDSQGNTYKTVKIGTQIWMVEDLKVTETFDGTSMQEISDNSQWETESNGGYVFSYYNNDPTQGYGVLYNHTSAIDACPNGWHLPSHQEFITLMDFLKTEGFENDEAIALKSQFRWNNDGSNSGNGIDKYGFSAFPGGFINPTSGESFNLGDYGRWWLSDIDGGLARAISINNDSNSISRDTYSNRKVGRCVRCVKD